jgi:NAD(P)-dependent dehydrogenase (short-subunit alcohol dehydrogenase family)
MSSLKVAIVTGAGQGIGAGCARSLAAAGFKIAAMSPSPRSKQVAESLGGVGLQGSVLEPSDIAALVDLAMGTYGRVDAVVNNMGHGGGLPDPVRKTTYDRDYEGPLLEIEDAVARTRSGYGWPLSSRVRHWLGLEGPCCRCRRLGPSPTA